MIKSTLDRRVAIITGGSRGIGKAIAKSFLLNGTRVVIAARSKGDITKTVAELKSMGEIIGVQTDVSREKEVYDLVRHASNEYGTIDILVNAAGVQNPIGTFYEVEISEWISNIQINLLGTVLCCKAVLPIMMAKKKGKIINFSGGGATGPRPHFSAYACSKIAIVKFTEILAEEVKDFGIQVNAIAPGAVNTRMLQEILNAGNRAGKKEIDEAKARVEKGGNPPELAAYLAVFLASEDSDGITGKLISAIWDPWGEEAFQKRLTEEKDLCTLRRIDDRMFSKRG